MTLAASPSAGQPTDRLVGESPATRTLRGHIRHLASFDAVGKTAVPTLLLLGETGTGKGLVARAMHDSGPRAPGPFIEVNCAAIPETLLEAELFGFEAGAFTDAKRAKLGLFEAASGGTLFLDEIDALPLVLQSKFLKAIEEKRVRRLGAVTEHTTDAKLIAATQADLSGRVVEGRFRADLYHRLTVVMLEIPPLRARREDILVLARRFLQHYAEAHGLGPRQLSPAAEAWLLNYGWPGNVRELSHLMERITLLSSGPLIDASSLERFCLPQSQPAGQPRPLQHLARETVDEPGQIAQALMRTGGNVTRAARLLGVGRGALRHRMRRYGLGRPVLEEAMPMQAVREGADGPRSEPASPIGSSAESSIHAAAWEQKSVAVLAIDLTFPDAVEMDTPFYEPRTARTRWERAIVEKVQGFGGVLLQRSPALLLAAFGIPRTLEQMPQRAVRAALAIRHLVREARSAEAGEPRPEVRLAVHLGAASVDVQAQNPVEQVWAVGDTLAFPVRLLGHAGPGDILISSPVERLVQGWFELRACKLPLSAGERAWIEAYSIAGLRRAEPTPPGIRTLGRFVGRERELLALLDLLEQVECGQGQVVGIVGEPGMGKTRLLYEFRRRLAEKPVTYLEGLCLSYGTATSYLPVLDLLRGLYAITETDGVEIIGAKMRAGLRELAIDAEDEAPYLLHLLGVRQGTDRLRALTPEALKRRTFDVLRQLCLRSSQRQPLILAIENLHWIDQTSQDFLASLEEGLTGAPILLLATYRPGYRPPWIEKSYVTQLALRPLSPQDSLSIVHAVSRTRPISTGLVQTILAKAEGNPFFLEELTQAVAEPGAQVSPQAVPDTIQGVLTARIDRLPEAPKRLLQTASVLGRKASRRLLGAIWEGAGNLDAHVLELKRSEFLYDQTGADEPVYVFKHALIQDVAYQTLAPDRRRHLHETAGRTIERLYQGRLEEHYEDLAHHFSLGEGWAKACGYATKAGNKAKTLFANREAIHFYTMALDAAARAAPPLSDEQLLLLYENRGQVWTLSTDYDAAAADFEAVLEAARRLGDRRREGEALCHLAQAHWLRFSDAHIGLVERYAQEALTIAREIGDDRILARSLTSLAFVDQTHGRLRDADAKFEESLRIAQHRAYSGITPINLAWLGAHANWRGEFQRVIGLCREGVQVAREVHEGFYELHTLSFLCLAHAALGQWDLAYAALHEGMAKAHDWNNMYFIARLTNSLGWFHSELGDVATALEHDQAGYELGLASKVTNTEISALINLGHDYLSLGQLGKARRILEDTLERVEREAFGSHRWRWKIRLCIGLGRLWSLEREPTRAMRLLEEGLKLAVATGSQKYVAEGRGLRGGILLTGGRVTEGVSELRQALALGEAISCPSLIWRLAQPLGRAYERQGDVTQAHAMYETAHSEVMAVAGRIADARLRETLLASPQAASIRDDLVRLGGLGA